MERNASTLTQNLGWYAIEGHLLDQLLKPIHALKKQSTLEVWQVCRPVQSCRSWRTHTGLGSVDIPRRRTWLFPIKTSQLIFESTLPQLRRQQLGAQGFYLSIIYLSICLSVYLSYPILSYLILSYPIVSYLILSYPILSYLILSCPILSYLILSYLILSCLSVSIFARGLVLGTVLDT